MYDIPIVQQRSSREPVTNHSLVVHHQSYQAPEVHQPSQASFPLMDSELVDPSFLPFNDPITSINKAIDFISTAFTSRYPSTNNQLRTSSNLRNQATPRWKSSSTDCSRETKSRAKVIRCYNYQEEGHMARHCTKPKRPRNSTWFKEKVMLAEALKSGMEIPTPTAFQTDDLDAFDSECDEASSHAALSVIDTEETLKLAEESRLKMHAKQYDPVVQEKKVLDRFTE
ncbi:retrovirus-related pol polyprotein from transposon TNT 1-94 [Tanacetum coccineum]